MKWFYEWLKFQQKPKILKPVDPGSTSTKLNLNMQFWNIMVICGNFTASETLTSIS